MLTSVTRFFLAHRVRPFLFLPSPGFLPGYDVPDFGLYVHVPFCETLCPFCPYCKTKYDQDLADSYVAALLAEIDLADLRLGKGRGKVTTLYFGGGSPALVARHIGAIISRFRERFGFDGDIGVELHPRDVKPGILDELVEAGVTMVSLGVQSFSPDCLRALGRTSESPLDALRALSSRRFAAVDVDLIFGIPGQTVESLRDDFRIAVLHGATQVSTYPFIDFSYATNERKPLGSKAKKEMLAALSAIADEMGFARTSVWTFARKGSPRYSSITRDNFLGFGPSATSLGRSDFKVNTFSVAEYVACAGKGVVPTALRMRFTERTRGMYWLFWNCYNGVISSDSYRDLFGRSLEADFGFWLGLAGILGFLSRDASDPSIRKLTERGSFAFHAVEQAYTLQYIDKTWKASLGTPWPRCVELY